MQINFKRIILISFGMLLFSNLYAQDSLFIKGQILGDKIDNLTLALSDITTSPPVVTTAKSGVDGSFSFKVPSAKLAIYRLYLTADNFLMLLMTGQDINLKLNSEKLNLNPEIAGSDDTHILYEIANKSSLFDQQLDSINKVYGAARSNENLADQLPLLQSAYEQTAENQKEVLRQSLMANPASPSALFFIDKLDIDADLAVYEKVAGSLFAKFPDYKLVSELHSRVELEKKLQPGNPAPEIIMPDQDGKLIKLSSMRGKVVLIDFWASWCSPCRRENPEVVRIYNRFKDKGFDIYGVSLDRDAKSWHNAIASDSLAWTHVGDMKYWQTEGALAYGVKSIPHTVLIDRNGIIIARKFRSKALEEKLEEIFGKD